MTIREKVARAMWADTNCGEGDWDRVESITQETYRSNAAVAVDTVLTAINDLAHDTAGWLIIERDLGA